MQEVILVNRDMKNDLKKGKSLLRPLHSQPAPVVSEVEQTAFRADCRFGEKAGVAERLKGERSTAERWMSPAMLRNPKLE